LPLIRFQAVIQQFEEQGEKTGWTYVSIPAEWAEKLIPGNKRAFRVKGKLDSFPIKGVSLIPMGGGDFIMALNATIRKGIGKRVGAMLALALEVDHTEFEIPADLIEWLNEVPTAKDYFEKLPKSHQRYWVNWLASVKSDQARLNRLERAVNALSQGFGFAEMLRAEKANKLK
jgi:hypothetical protein